MSSSNGPVLYLKLDALGSDGKTVLDSSGNQLNGTLSGDVTVVADPLLGGCVELAAAGAQIDVPDASALDVPGDLTLACWILVLAGPTEGAPWIVLLGKGAAPDYSLVCCPDLNVISFRPQASVPLIDDPGYAFPGGSFPRNTWIHVAGVQRGDRGVVYVDGVKVSEGNVAGTRGSTGAVSIGQGSFAGPYCRLADACVFARALSSDEIWQLYSSNQKAPFRASFPISFDLENEDGEDVLYLDDHPAGPVHTLYVRLGNLSGRAVNLLPQGSPVPSVADHHFELRFRPGTLSVAPGAPLTTASVSAGGGQWVVSQPVTNADRTVSVYLLCTSSGASLAAGSAVTVGIGGLVAASAGGSRATRVLLRYGAISFGQAGTTPPPTWIEGSRTRILNIVNDRGKKYSPLHFGASGNHRVLNDGQTPGAVSFRLANTSRDTDIVLQGASNQAPSALLLTFDTGESATGADLPWALGSAANLAKCVVTAPEGLRVEADASGPTPRWKLTPSGASFTLAPLQSIELTLTGIVTAYPRGQTNAYLRYENVPGYWDRTLVCPLEKSPMLFDDAKSSRDTGAGAALLDFNGSLQLRGSSISLSGTLPSDATGPADFQAREALVATTLPDVPGGPLLAINPRAASGTETNWYQGVLIGGSGPFEPQGSPAPGTPPEAPPTLLVCGGVRAKGGPPGILGAHDAGYAFHGNGGDNDSGMFSSADGLLQLFANSCEVVRVQQVTSGALRVGILNETPQYALDVGGTLSATCVTTPSVQATNVAVTSFTTTETLNATASLTSPIVTASHQLALPGNSLTWGKCLCCIVKYDGANASVIAGNITATFNRDSVDDRVGAWSWYIQLNDSPFQCTPMIVANYAWAGGNWDPDLCDNPIVPCCVTYQNFYLRVGENKQHTIVFFALEIAGSPV